MKKYILAIVISCCVSQCFGQNNFEGVITYNFNIEGMRNPVSSSTKVYFKQHKILIQSIGANDSNTVFHETLFDFDSGFVYNIDKEMRTILKDSINKVTFKSSMPQFFNDSIKNILNYECKLTKYEKLNVNEDHAEDLHVWYSGNLEFTLPQHYYPFLPCLLFSNGKNICLSASAIALINSNTNARVETKAQTINSMTLPDSIFTLPQNFSISLQPTDTTAKSGITVETKMTISVKKGENDPPPPPPPPGGLTPPKKKAGTKIAVPSKTVKTTSVKGKQ